MHKMQVTPSKPRKIIILAIVSYLCAGFPILALGQSQGTRKTEDTFTINTYYPSPQGIYRTIEAKRSLAVGEVKNDHKISTIDNLAAGQLYVGNSIILRSQASDPANGKPGEIIYNSPDKMLKFFNGTAWVNVTSKLSSFPECGSSNGQTLGVEPAGTTLCDAGTPSAVVASSGSTWTWTCSMEELSVSCGAAKVCTPTARTLTWTDYDCWGAMDGSYRCATYGSPNTCNLNEIQSPVTMLNHSPESPPSHYNSISWQATCVGCS